MKKTFIEVIMSIKDGETWESEVKRIERIGGRIDITVKGVFNSRTMCFGNNKSYSLVVKLVSFAEAFEAYEDGKIIKSLVGRKLSYKKSYTNKEELYLNERDNNWCNNFSFGTEEIRGQWQILD